MWKQSVIVSLFRSRVFQISKYLKDLEESNFFYLHYYIFSLTERCYSYVIILDVILCLITYSI